MCTGKFPFGVAMLAVVVILFLSDFNSSIHVVCGLNTNHPAAKIYTNVDFNQGTAVAAELPITGSCSTVESGNGERPIRACYFDRSQVCSRSGYCPIDDRPCNANRNYLDHEYQRSTNNVAEPTDDDKKLDIQADVRLLAQMLKLRNKEDLTITVLNFEDKKPTKNVLEEVFGPPSSNNQHLKSAKKQVQNKILLPYMLLSRQERKLRRKRLFLMSTWLEDLLPDPHQGRDPFSNAVTDTFKIICRAIQLILSLGRLVPPPPRVTF